MARIENTTRAFGSVCRYIQGPGEINRLKDHMAEFGKRGYALIDEAVFDELKEKLDAPDKSGVTVACGKFSGEVTEQLLIDETEKARKTDADCVVGIGGGKAVDAAKVIAGELKVPTILVPSIASTDAPVASMSVVFEEDGTQKRIIRFLDCPEIILVDTDIIVNAPARYFSAGIGDALATCYEAKASAASDHQNFVGPGYRKTLAGVAICEACERTVWEKGVSALRAVEKHLCTPDVEDVIEANTLLSGLGFINVGLGGAHATNTGLTVLSETSDTLHGELVAFGVIVQFIIEQRPESEVDALLTLLEDLRLPTTLRQLGINEMTQDMLGRVCAKAASGFWSRSPILVTEKMIGDAIMMADELGKQHRR